MAGTYNITIEQGATFNLPIVMKNSDGTYYDLTGWTPRGQIRKRHRSTDIIASFSFILTDPTNGALTITMPAATTMTIPAGESLTEERSRYVWDFEIYRAIPGGEEVKRILEGMVYVSPEVTR